MYIYKYIEFIYISSYIYINSYFNIIIYICMIKLQNKKYISVFKKWK